MYENDGRCKEKYIFYDFNRLRDNRPVRPAPGDGACQTTIFHCQVQTMGHRKERRAGFISTFGCQMNAHDSEKLMGILLEAGFTEGQSEESDFVLYNTCTVRENANQRVYGRLGYLNSLKKKNPHMIISLCGCMMQEPEVVEKLKKSYRFVDIIFGTHNIYKLAELLSERIDGRKW